MSLSQEPLFSAKSSYRKKLSIDIPTRKADTANLYTTVLRRKFEKASKKQKVELYELMSETVMILLNNASQRNRKNFTKLEQTEFWKIANMYNRLKQEFGREVLG